MSKKITTQILLLFLIFSSLISSAQNFTDSEIKSAFIFQFCQNIEWTNESHIEKFKIGIYGNDTSMLFVLNLLAKSQQIKNKDIEIIKYNKISDFNNNFPHLLFITREKNWDIKTLRCLVGVIEQDTFLFSTSIRNNINYGKDYRRYSCSINKYRAYGFKYRSHGFQRG